jgi:hypothetical protein
MSRTKKFNQQYVIGTVYKFSKAAAFKKFLEEGVAFAKTVEGLPTLSIEISKEPLEVLAGMNVRNRPFNRANAAALRLDMEQDRFKHSADPILVSDLLELLSSQHRVGAALEYGKPVRFNISFGMTFEDSVICMDRNSTRSPSQIIQYTCGVSGKHASICRMAWFAPGVHERKTTSAETEEMTKLMLPNVNTAAAMLSGCTLKAKSAALIAAVARAIPHAKLEILEHFCDIYRKGPDYQVRHQHAYEKGPLKLRESILRSPVKGSRNARREGYAKIQAALAAFIRQRDRRSLRSTTAADCFPLVGKAKAAYEKWTALHEENKLSPEVVAMVTQNSRLASLAEMAGAA